MSAMPDTSLGRRSIGEILLEHGHVTQEQIDEAEAIAADGGRPVGQILVEAGAITRLELASALAEQWSDTGAPIAPPGSIAATVSTFDLPAPAPLPVVAPDQSELTSRIEHLEEALDRLGTGEGDDAANAELRASVEDVSGRLLAMEPVLEELAKSIESISAADDRDALLAQHATILDELSQRLESVTASVDGASRRTSELAEEAAQALESFRDGLAAVSERLPGFAGADDVTALAELVDALSRRPTRDEELVVELAEVRAAVDALAKRPSGNPELVVQVDTLAARLAEIGDRVDVLAAAAQATPGDPAAVEELREAFAELARRPLADPEAERRLEGVASTVEELGATVEALAARPAGDPEIDDKLWQLTARLEELERAEALEEIRSRLVDLAELTERPAVDPVLAQRLDDVERRLDDVPGDDVLERIDHDAQSLGYRIDGVIARLDELATTIDQQAGSAVSREAWDDAVALLNSRIEAEAEAKARLGQLEERLAQVAESSAVAPVAAPDTELPAMVKALQERIAQVEAMASAPAPAAKGSGAPDPALGKQLAALSGRVDQLAADVAGAPRANGEGEGAASAPTAPPTLERDVEHVLMAIERLSVHLGAHERALTELMGSGGLVAQVRELSARVSDIEAFGGGGGGEGGGGGGDGAMRSELRTLMRRLEEAEEAQRTDREKLIQQLEKAAGAIDWRLQRLETSKTESDP